MLHWRPQPSYFSLKWLAQRRLSITKGTGLFAFNVIFWSEIGWLEVCSSTIVGAGSFVAPAVTFSSELAWMEVDSSALIVVGSFETSLHAGFIDQLDNLTIEFILYFSIGKPTFQKKNLAAFKYCFGLCLYTVGGVILWA